LFTDLKAVELVKSVFSLKTLIFRPFYRPLGSADRGDFTIFSHPNYATGCMFAFVHFRSARNPDIASNIYETPYIILLHTGQKGRWGVCFAW